jgi:hypothetical protein
MRRVRHGETIMNTWRRYVGATLGLALLAGLMSFSQTGPAIAQNVLKPAQSLIVNDAATPVPVVAAAPLAVSPPLWQGTPFATSEVVLNPSGVQRCEPSFAAPAGSVVLLTAVSGSFSVPQGGDGSMSMKFTLPDNTTHIIEVPMHATAKARQATGLFDQFTGSLAFGGFPVVAAESCLIGDNSSGQLDFIGFVVPLPQ